MTQAHDPAGEGSGRDPGTDVRSEPGGEALSRRRFLQSTGGATAGVACGLGVADAAAQGAGIAPPKALLGEPAAGGLRHVSLRINGVTHELRIEARVTLLDAVREVIGLTGTKKGCDRGQCGACTVLVDGRRINACMTLAVMHEGSEVTTIEGLGTPDALHPMQAAFIRNDAFQCGYCTPGQICSAVAAVGELKAGALSAASFESSPGSAALSSARAATMRIAISDAEIKERMSGNLCRCGAYSNIVTAVRSVAEASS